MTSGTMKAWRTHAYGDPLKALVLDTVDIPTPGDFEVLVKAQGIPLNLNDLERIRGGNMMAEPKHPYAPGMETMGIVTAVGKGANHLMGKRVVAITKGAHGGFAEYCVCPMGGVFEMPESVPLPDAAAIFFPFHLAWLGLVDRAEVKAGEWVLIHAGAGGAGSAAIQIAVDAGAHVIATAGSDEKLKFCKDLGAEVAVNYKTGDYLKTALEVTGNKGVDVVFDNIGEAVWEKSAKATAYNGRYLTMGFASNKRVADEKFYVPRILSLGNFKLCGVMLSYVPGPGVAMMKQNMGWNFPSTALGAQITAKIVEKIVAKKIRPVIGKTVSFADVPQAFDDFAESRTVGRTVVVM